MDVLHQKHGSAPRSTNLVEHLRGCPKFGGVEKNHPPCHQLDGKKTSFYSFPSSSSSCTPTRPSRRPRHPSSVATPPLAGDALPPTVYAPPPPSWLVSLAAAVTLASHWACIWLGPCPPLAGRAPASGNARPWPRAPAIMRASSSGREKDAPCFFSLCP